MKYLKKIIYYISILLKQKSVRLKNGKKIKYILKKSKNSDELIISFSGFPGEGNKAKYNYIRTLSKVKKNQIFILDSFGFQSAGSYYLGENGDYFLENAIIVLIQNIKKSLEIKKIYTIGSSKGGWASIYYGILLNAQLIISGASQYYIGDYLNTNEYHKKLLEGIVGENICESKINMLNNKLPDLIKSSNNIQKIKFIIHYSKQEHTYEEHIKYLIKDLKNVNANIEEDTESYLEHKDVGKYFKNLLITIFKNEGE